MSLTTDIVATYRGPRRVIRRLLEGGEQEARALMFLIVACVLIFVAQWPRLRLQRSGQNDLWGRWGLARIKPMWLPWMKPMWSPPIKPMWPMWIKPMWLRRIFKFFVNFFYYELHIIFWY